MSNNFTAKAEAALNRAVELAEEYGHTYIGTEHVLLAIAEDRTSCASILLKKHKITTEQISRAVKELIAEGKITYLDSKKIRGKKIHLI